jgi:hypothetical protein
LWSKAHKPLTCSIFLEEGLLFAYLVGVGGTPPQDSLAAILRQL